MPALTNTRHELFAQGLAKGKTQEQAYIDAGYSKNEGTDSAAARLYGNVRIAARVAELQERGAIKVELTLEDIITELQEAREVSRKNGQGAGMVAASKAKAELLGLGAPKKIAVGGSDDMPAVQTVTRIELVAVKPSGDSTD